jgi:hypothetical protein
LKSAGQDTYVTNKKHTYSFPNRPLINPNLSFVGEVKTLIREERNSCLFAVRMNTSADINNEGAEAVDICVYMPNTVYGISPLRGQLIQIQG